MQEYPELWQILDTSIKVGLGALICGFCVWLSNKRPGEPTLKRNHRRLEILESVSLDVGNINHLFAKYSSLVIESIHYQGRWPQARRDELQKVNAELVKEFRKMAHAEANLLMLGEKNLETTLRLYGAKIAHFRKQVYTGRQDITEQEVINLKQDIAKLRETFYDLLSKKYDRLLAI